MEQRPIDDVFLEGIKKQIEAANDTIAQALRKGTSVELEIDVYGHLQIIEVKKNKISDKRF